jgi:hypothetical protein
MYAARANRLHKNRENIRWVLLNRLLYNDAESGKIDAALCSQQDKPAWPGDKRD